MRYSRFDQEISVEDSAQVTLDLALWFANGISDGDTRERLFSYLQEDKFRQILEEDGLESGLSSHDYRLLRQVQALYSKRQDLDMGVDLDKVAIEKFRSAEVLCKETNDIFRLRTVGRFQLRPRTERVLFHAARKIQSILRDVPSLSELKFRFGPGATTQVPRRNACANEKLAAAPSCSVELFPLAHCVLQEMPAWFGRETPVPMVQTGKVSFVPKSWKESRSIVVEPTLNTMCQAAVGDLMADRLRLAGIDIRDQARNQRLAKRGSEDGTVATVDLSSASDTVSTELVYDLLGLEWASFLARFRTGHVTLNGETLTLQKFSSMGNGFTFPLETLIFYAVAWGSTIESGGDLSLVSAYGDDIIVPSGAVEVLFESLNACGFVVNEKKSYSKGPFRESCGKDYFLGTDVRPFFLRGEGPLRVCDLFKAHNYFYRDFAREVCAYLVTYFDESILLYGPDGYGDGHLLGDYSLRRRRKHARNGFGGYLFDTFSFKPRRTFRRQANRVLPCYSIYLSPPAETATRLLGVDGHRHYLDMLGDPRPPSHGYDRGEFHSVVPGYDGYRRISIYLFA